jgi:NADH:ubiquinone oxidoreductase subunit 4 (subunit M)
MESLNPIILSLVTFIPAAGGLLILLIPRRDRDIKLFALVISLLAFVASLHLPVHLHRDHNLSSSRSTKSGSRRPTFITTWASTESPSGWWC